MKGFGRVIGNLAYATRGFEPAVHQPPNDWVRVSMWLHPTFASVGVSWHDSEGLDGWPGQQASSLEWDLPIDPGQGPNYFFTLKHSETGSWSGNSTSSR
jgi:hypothetical protein